VVFTPLEIPGAFLIEPELKEDERGFFARTWCGHEFAARGLNAAVAQCSVSYNRRRGTVRGLHYQAIAEEKLVRCTRGAVWDVMVDVRPGSPTCHRWTAVELTETNHKALYIPTGVAHGFQTLQDDSEVLYQMSAYYVPDASRRLRWNDPAFGIPWPLPVSVISDEDAAVPLLPPGAHDSTVGEDR
jgi:dTDP-4-dehydrorhamnose 3,5-epimerase